MARANVSRFLPARNIRVGSVQTTRRGACVRTQAAHEEDAPCSVLNITVDNVKCPKYTVMSVEVMAYPGLLRTVAWTINGLGVRAQNATMETEEDGFAVQKYWLTDISGNKLSDSMADNVRESLQMFVETCMPPGPGKEQQEWVYNNTIVSNSAHPMFTELVILGEPNKPGFMLEIATVMSAIGATVQSMSIQGDREFECAPICRATARHNFDAHGRCFRFLLTDGASGGKLTAGRVASVLYTLDLVAGKGYQPTVLSASPASLGKRSR
ncbi:hypothetical protein FOA52_014391 [Chlamydomonas sp. UWO 241]|nr:hypothetical protein FOA52_014391 [Chlamydomonas sp. UWO 241]